MSEWANKRLKGLKNIWRFEIDEFEIDELEIDEIIEINWIIWFQRWFKIRSWVLTLRIWIKNS